MAAYLKNKDLLTELINCKQTGIMSDKFATMLQLLVHKFADKPHFSGWTFREDMEAYAMMHLVRTWKRFNTDKYCNAFAFYTQCIKASFYQYLNKESVQWKIRDQILIDTGQYIDPHRLNAASDATTDEVINNNTIK